MSELEITVLRNRIEYKFDDMKIYAKKCFIDYYEFEEFLTIGTPLYYNGPECHDFFEFTFDTFQFYKNDTHKINIRLTESETKQYKEEFRKKLDCFLKDL